MAERRNRKENIPLCFISLCNLLGSMRHALGCSKLFAVLETDPEDSCHIRPGCKVDLKVNYSTELKGVSGAH